MDPKFGQKSEFVSSTDLIPCNVQSSLAAVQAPYIACLYAWVFEPGLGGPYRASPKRTSMDPKFGQKSEFVSSTDLIPCNVQSSLAAVQAPYIACLYAWVFEPGLGGPYRASPKRTSMDPKFGQKSEFVSSTDLIPCNVQSSLAAVQAPEHRPDNFYFYPLFTALF